MSDQKVVTRFAPSPTGFLHVGGLRTALYAYLVAKQNNGTFILRIEDTDRERFVEGGIENILESLYWSTIIPDEGVHLKDDNVIQTGSHGPYIQSERLPIYKKYADELLEKGHAFYCFCTPERLAQVREERQKSKLPPGYDGFCKKLSKKEVDERLSRGENHVVRLSMPDEGETAWNDLVHGEVSFKNSDVDDQVLMKSDGYPTYHLAVVVDDHEMQVTHVIRGDEWISSTPKHLQLYSYFGWTPPAFAHLPLLLNADKSKLSKRQGDVAVLDYREKGYLPEALVNFVAFLGWNPGTEQEIFSLKELIETFDLKKVGKAGAVFNLEKLDWYNREYLKKMNPSELTDYIATFLPEHFKQKMSPQGLGSLAPILLERISKGSDLQVMEENGELGYFFERPVYIAEKLLWKNIEKKVILENIENAKTELESIPENAFSATQVKDTIMEFLKDKEKGPMLHPLRFSLSGLDKSPDPFVIAEVLGKTETLERLKIAKDMLAE